MKLPLSAKKGFTLVELLVSVTIFSIVVTMAVGAMLVLIDANAKAQNMQETMTNLTFAIDSISREVRTGSGLYCSDIEPSDSLAENVNRNCDSGGVFLSVVEGGESLTGTGEARITYWINSESQQIERRIGNGEWFPLTNSSVKITNGTFYVSDSDTGLAGDEEQANATISLEGYAGDIENTDSSFAVQTTVTERILDI